jgi:hypothetical protein
MSDHETVYIFGIRMIYTNFDGDAIAGLRASQSTHFLQNMKIHILGPSFEKTYCGKILIAACWLGQPWQFSFNTKWRLTMLEAHNGKLHFTWTVLSYFTFFLQCKGPNPERGYLKHWKQAWGSSEEVRYCSLNYLSCVLPFWLLLWSQFLGLFGTIWLISDEGCQLKQKGASCSTLFHSDVLTMVSPSCNLHLWKLNRKKHDLKLGFASIWAAIWVSITVQILVFDVYTTVGVCSLWYLTSLLEITWNITQQAVIWTSQWCILLIGICH